MAETYTSRTLRELLRIVAGRFLGMVIIIAIIVGAVGLQPHTETRRTEKLLSLRFSTTAQPRAGETGKSTDAGSGSSHPLQTGCPLPVSHYLVGAPMVD